MSIRVWRSISILGLLLPAIVIVAKSDDHEQRVKDFQNAVNYAQDGKGCLSIPYPDIQDQCKRKQADVIRWCKESGRFNCEEVDPKKMQKEIENLKTQRDDLKSQRAEQERKKSAATNDSDKRECEDKIKEIDNKLYELDKARGDLERQVNEASKIVSDRMYVAKACRDARPEVMQVFRNAKSKADDERDPDIQTLAQKLIKYWESEEAGHDEQIRGVKEAVEKCDRILYDIGHLGDF